MICSAASTVRPETCMRSPALERARMGPSEGVGKFAHPCALPPTAPPSAIRALACSRSYARNPAATTARCDVVRLRCTQLLATSPAGSVPVYSSKRGGTPGLADQLQELHKQGFYRARRGPVIGNIILERVHCEAVCGRQFSLCIGAFPGLGRGHACVELPAFVLRAEVQPGPCRQHRATAWRSPSRNGAKRLYQRGPSRAHFRRWSYWAVSVQVGSAVGGCGGGI